MKDLLSLIQKVIFVPVHPAGWPFILGAALITTITLLKVSRPLGLIFLVITLWCVFFFRDPARVTPVRKGLIVSPADGIVQMITLATPPPELDPESDDDPLFREEGVQRVSVFLNVFDVHVNRVPADGTIVQSHYHPGKFLSANLDKASEENERSSVLLRTEDGKHSIAFVQIAGLVARRIINDLKPGQQVKAGQRYGIIRFGSRADIYLPPGVAPQVIVGQRVIGGETVIADLDSSEPAREGETR